MEINLNWGSVFHFLRYLYKEVTYYSFHLGLGPADLNCRRAIFKGPKLLTVKLIVGCRTDLIISDEEKTEQLIVSEGMINGEEKDYERWKL